MNFNMISLKSLSEIKIKNFACALEGNKTQILSKLISLQDYSVAQNLTGRAFK